MAPGFDTFSGSHEQETVMADEVGYVNPGPEGRRCADCANYKPSEGNPDVGTCQGYDVQATASCNYYEAKQE
jgi:hypothetical protein